MIHDRESLKIHNEYFEWMYHLVCSDNKGRRKISYRRLLTFLDSVIYIPRLEMDDNRRIDGIDLRYQFGYENGYPDAYINTYLDNGDCSMLEMMVALACKVEQEITDNYIYGDRTSQWFWSMIISLGLNSMEDSKFDLNYSRKVVDNFLSQNYKPNGVGGLFTLEHPTRDLRDVDIWCQFMWYLNENLTEEEA